MSDRPLLWTGTLSPFSAKVRIALAEKGVDYEAREVPWTRARKWEPKPEGLLAANPHGKVPVWVEPGLVLWDSTLICEYLEERHPEPALMPADPADRARCRRWEDDADAAIDGPVSVLIREVFLVPDPAARDAEAVEAARSSLARHYARLDAELAGREWISGAAFGLADGANAILLLFASAVGAPPEGFASLDAWLERVRARPSVAKEIASIPQAAAAA